MNDVDAMNRGSGDLRNCSIHDFSFWDSCPMCDGRIERENEIVALFNAERYALSHGDEYYRDPFGYAIALIEGENNE